MGMRPVRSVAGLKEALYSLVSAYFAGASVLWEYSDAAKPPLPLVTLHLGSVSASPHPCAGLTEGGGEICARYLSRASFSVQLFTRGRRTESGETHYYEDTAAEDMAGFLLYMGSERTVEACGSMGISVEPSGETRVLSAALAPGYERRAFQEFSVLFLQEARGFAGVSGGENFVQTPSGGGTEELANMRMPELSPGGTQIRDVTGEEA